MHLLHLLIEEFLRIFTLLKERSLWLLFNLLLHADPVNVDALLVTWEAQWTLLWVLYVVRLLLFLRLSWHHLINCCVVFLYKLKFSLLLLDCILPHLLSYNLFDNQDQNDADIDTNDDVEDVEEVPADSIPSVRIGDMIREVMHHNTEEEYVQLIEQLSCIVRQINHRLHSNQVLAEGLRGPQWYL